MTSDRIDAIVDEVAGALTAVEPRRDFTARVMTRIADEDAPRPTWRAAWLVAAVAAVVSIVIVVFVARSFVAAPRRDGVRVAETPLQPARGVVPPKPAIADRSTTDRSTAERSTTRRAGTVRTAATTADRSPWDIDPLVTPPIDVAPLTVDLLAPEPIPLERLDTIRPVDVAPLTIDDRQRRQE
jgi:hypothetical protein